MSWNWDAIGVFASAFAVSAFAGVAALLRSNTPLTRKTVATAVSNSGILGLGISLLWYAKFQDNLYALVGVCVIAGLGGMTTIDFVLEALKKGGISVRVGQGGSVSAPGVQVANEPEKESTP